LKGGEDEPSTFTKEFTFKDFKEAFAWLTKVAQISEELNHHPTILNTYNRVTISIYTHDAGGVTQKDIDWISTVEKNTKEKR